MKKIYLFSTILLVSIGALQAFPRLNDNRGLEKIELKKHISKTFKTSQDGDLAVTNRYGKIMIETWNLSQVNFEIDVISRSGSTKKAQETLDRIKINFDQNGGQIEAETIIEETSGWFNWSNENADMEINYIIKMPSTMALDLQMKYGNIYLPSYDGKASVSLSYGNLNANDLNSNFEMNLKYGDARLGCIKDLNLNLAYGNLDISSCNTMDLDIKYGKVNVGSAVKSIVNSKYSDFSFVTVDDLRISGGYDHVQIDEASRVDFNNKYSDITVGKLNNAMLVNASYNSSTIRDISNAAKKLEFYGKYSSVKIKSNASYSYEVTGKYLSADIFGKNKLENQDGSYFQYIGKKGQGEGAKIIIQADYGNVYLN